MTKMKKCLIKTKQRVPQNIIKISSKHNKDFSKTKYGFYKKETVIYKKRNCNFLQTK